MALVVLGDSIRLTPETAFAVVSFKRNDFEAKWHDTNDDEHAVSVQTEGPDVPYVYAIRPAMYAAPLPMMACGGGMDVPVLGTSERYSWYMHPTYTPTVDSTEAFLCKGRSIWRR